VVKRRGEGENGDMEGALCARVTFVFYSIGLQMRRTLHDKTF
jgi:hypothetical protein